MFGKYIEKFEWIYSKFECQTSNSNFEFYIKEPKDQIYPILLKSQKTHLVLSDLQIRA